MDSIIDKLGIESGYYNVISETYPGSMTATTKKVFVESEAMVRVKNAALAMFENEIKNLEALEMVYEGPYDLGLYRIRIRSRVENTRFAIEKATGRTWAEIKELI